jgi:hypothetical protein
MLFHRDQDGIILIWEVPRLFVEKAAVVKTTEKNLIHNI